MQRMKKVQRFAAGSLLTLCSAFGLFALVFAATGEAPAARAWSPARAWLESAPRRFAWRQLWSEGPGEAQAAARLAIPALQQLAARHWRPGRLNWCRRQQRQQGCLH